MADVPDNNDNQDEGANKSDWGPRLFFITLAAVLAFFYWLLIYSGGVTVHHG
jgi:hypothetical protein